MRCHRCNTYNNEYHIYCYNCGAKLGNRVNDDEQYDLDLLHESFERIMPESSLDTEQNERPEYVEHSKDIEYSENMRTRPDLNRNSTRNSSQMPIDENLPLKRRSRKAKKQDDKGLKILIRVCSIIIVISLLAFAGLIFYDKVLKGRLAPTADNELNISANYSAIQDTIDGIPVHKIVVETDIGEQVKILDKTVQVKDGKAEIIFEDNELIDLGKETTPNGEIKVTLDVTISATGAKDRQDKVSFKIASRAAPVNMIHPKTDEYVTDDETLTLLMKVMPDSKVLINGDNFSDLITEEGKLEKTFNLTDEPEQEFEILVSTKGFEDNIRTVKVKRSTGDSNVTLKLDQKQPIKSKDEWVKVTGITEPNATLDADIEVRQDPKIDSDGRFIIFVKASNMGYTPCTLTASSDSGESTDLDLVLERATTEAEYTSQAWEFIYDDMVKDPSMHNGKIFLLTGKVTEILSLDSKYAFTLDISSSETSNQLVYVEYWGNIKLEEGQSLKVFGNRWGNKDNMPKILAKFMYKV